MAKAENIATVDGKLALLDDMERPDLIELFKDWQPRHSPQKKVSAPLDQRLSVAVSEREKRWLTRELDSLSKSGEKVSISQFVRNRAMSNVDINGWREMVEQELGVLEDTFENQTQMRAREKELVGLMEDEDDEEEVQRFETQLADVRGKLSRIQTQPQDRKLRLTGRVSMKEAETIRWRAQRLCIGTSDYLRLLIFDLSPVGQGDAHLSYDAKRRFYISVIDVAYNGWGHPPNVYECSQCAVYLEELRKARLRVKQLEKFA